MGQCGCGDMNPVKALRLGDTVIVIDEYWGCRDCGTPMGIGLLFFDSEENAREWIDDMPIETILPCKYGGSEGRGYMHRLIGKDEMVKAGAGEDHSDVDIHQYSSLEFLMHDFGLSLLQEAMAQRPKETQ